MKHPKGKRRSSPRLPKAAGDASSPNRSESPPLLSAIGAFLANLTFGQLLGRVVGLYAVFWLGIGGVMLTIAWNAGPRQLVESRDYAALSQTISGRIVASWLALEMNPAEIGDNRHWRPFAKVSPCVVVEYDPGQWQGPLQRSFCGNRFAFSEDYTLHDLDQLAPQVPFSWIADQRGFALAEIRMSRASLDWLSTHPAADTSANVTPITALEQLQRYLDHPLDFAIAGWTTAGQDFPLAVNPDDPLHALPAGFLAERSKIDSNWLIVALFSVFGLVAWSRGMVLLLGDIRPTVLWVMIILPVLAIPWWGDGLPRVLRLFDVRVSGVIGDILADLDPLSRLISGDPSAAIQGNGVRLVWPVGQGEYAATLGKLAFVRPEERPVSADNALRLLAETVGNQVKVMSPADQLALFAQLASDKRQGTAGAGLVFLPTAREVLLDPDSDERVKNSAYDFLSVWLTQPVIDPLPGERGFEQRLRFFRELTDLPIAEIANRARWVVNRAETAKQGQQ
jgi:hypothetical protein